MACGGRHIGLVHLHCWRILCYRQYYAIIGRMLITLQSFDELLAARALVGVGEASYVTVAPSIIADLYTIP